MVHSGLHHLRACSVDGNMMVKKHGYSDATVARILKAASGPTIGPMTLDEAKAYLRLGDDIRDRWLARHQEHDEMQRAKVRDGTMTLDDYLTNFKGFKPEHLDMVREGFRKAIFG